MLHHGGADIRAAQLGASFDFIHRLGFQLIAMLLQKRPLGHPGPPSPDGQEDAVGVTQIRAGVLHNAPEILKLLPLALEDRAHPPIEREPAQVGAPRNPYTLEPSIEPFGEDGRIRGIATGVARIGPRQDAQQESGVAHRSGQLGPSPRSRQTASWWGRWALVPPSGEAPRHC